MTPPAAEELFQAALDLPPAERDGFVAVACAGNSTVLSRVRELLAAHHQIVGPLDAPPLGVPTADYSPASDRPGIQLGPYKLLQKLGEGGMGAVWMAEQSGPVRRKVAVKLVRPGMDSKTVLARFEAERQALALMDHPNIAKVFDAGEAPDGRPYFVMELVKGVPITKYCDDHKLTPRQRLELFVPVCQAVQHAHQKGIIHRDLKPNNVLVAPHDSRPVPTVIDFGVAKATGARLTDKTLFTEFGAVVGTPEYMSPEQAELNQLDIDTRSDVYSLGVLLYELLTGTTPVTHQRTKGVALFEVLRIIREEDPPKPSTRLSTLGDVAETVSTNRSTEPRRLTALVKGELDWIVMKSLEKDRNRRYESASAFAADVERYLKDEPVLACPPSAGYRLRKVLRRNKGPVLAASIVFLALVGGMIGTTLGLVEARRQEKSANKSAEDEKTARGAAVESEADTTAYADFLANYVLAATRPQGQQGGIGRNVTMEEALAKAEPRIGEVFRGRPKAEALARMAIGVTWRNLGRYAKAEEHLRMALALRERELGPLHLATLTTRKSLAVTLLNAGRTDDAIPMLEEIVQGYTTTVGPDSPYTLNTLTSLARAYEEIGRPDKGLPLMEASLPKSRINPGPDDPDTLDLMNNLALAYQNAGRQEEALAIMQEVFDRRKAKDGAESIGALLALSNMAGFYASEGQTAKALALYEPTLATLKEKLGADHPVVLQAYCEMGGAYVHAGQADRAAQMLQDVFDKLKATLGADHPFTLKAEHDLGVAQVDAGQPEKGRTTLERALKGRTAKLGPDHPDTWRTMNMVAERYRIDRQPRRAVTMLEDAHARQKVRLSPDHPDALVTLRCLATAYLESDQLGKAVPMFERTLALQKVRFGPNHPQTLLTTNNLAFAYQRVGRTRESLPLLEHVVEQNTLRFGPTHPSTLAPLSNLARGHWSVGNHDRGLELRERLVAAHRKQHGDKHPLTLINVHVLGIAYAELGQFDRALPLFEEAVNTHKKEHGADHPQTLNFMASLAAALGDAGEYQKADPILRDLLDRQSQKDGPESLPAAYVRALLGMNLLRQDKPAEAELSLRECLRIRGQKIPEDWRTFMTRLQLGAALLAQKKDTEAEPLLDQGLDGIRQREQQIPALGKRNINETVERVARLYDRAGNKDKAAAWRSKLPTAKTGNEPKK
jgi:serine/threonine protein kinase